LPDGYFEAVTAGMTLKPTWMNNFIVTPTLNKAGLFTMQIFVKGIPYNVTVDDYIPVYYSKSSKSYFPYFSQQGSGGAIWPMLVEKVWAKVNGNYYNTISGV
jgi:hypothetical protein